LNHLWLITTSFIGHSLVALRAFIDLLLLSLILLERIVSRCWVLIGRCTTCWCVRGAKVSHTMFKDGCCLVLKIELLCKYSIYILDPWIWLILKLIYKLWATCLLWYRQLACDEFRELEAIGKFLIIGTLWIFQLGAQRLKL